MDLAALASLGHTILVGRGGNVITARLPNVFHVRLGFARAAEIIAQLALQHRHAFAGHEP